MLYKKRLRRERIQCEKQYYMYGLSDMSQSNCFCDLSETWLNAIDREGLIHVNRTTFKMFHAIEMESWQYLTIANIQDMDQKFKNKNHFQHNC